MFLFQKNSKYKKYKNGLIPVFENNFGFSNKKTSGKLFLKIEIKLDHSFNKRIIIYKK